MCRWLAYSGPSIHLDTLVVRPENSLVHQSRDALEAKSALNADGCGIGWYGEREHPGLFRDVYPAWNDDNLLNVCEQVRARLFFGHVRASTGTAINRANCHPFRHGNWLFMHNGQIGGFDRVRRDLTLAVGPEHFHHLGGTTDSEVFFYLALTNGLMDDPVVALTRTTDQVLETMDKAGVTEPFRLTAALSNGETIYAIRYASDDKPPSLYYACGDNLPDYAERPDDATKACLIVSEPLDETGATWTAVEADHILISDAGGITVSPFKPSP